MGDYYSQGRQHALDASPRCCTGDDCLQRSQGRNAVLTSLRNDAYLPLLKVPTSTWALFIQTVLLHRAWPH